MTEYRYHQRTFDKTNETIELPEDATGLTVDDVGDVAVVKYLTPTGNRCPDCGSADLEPTGAGKQCQLCGWHRHG